MRRILCALACLAATTAIAGRVAIVEPREGDVVRDNEGRVPVVLSASLASGERLRVLIDDVAIQSYGEGERITLINVSRGEHRLQVEVVDPSGAVVNTSAPVTFSMLRVPALRRSRDAGGPEGPGQGEPEQVFPPPAAVGAPSTTNPPGEIGTPSVSNPPAAIGAPSSINPPGAIGAPSATNPPSAIGAPSTNNPPASVGTPSTNNPPAGVGAPGPNNPAATVGRPAASAPGR